MKNILKTDILVIFFVLLVFMAKIGVPFLSIIVHLALPILMGLLLYTVIKRDEFKENKIILLLEYFYKMIFVVTIYFSLNKYFGKDILYVASFAVTLGYILLGYFKFKKISNILTAVLYINLISGFLVFLR